MSVFYRRINWTCCSSGCSNSSGLLQWDGMLLTLYSVLWRHRAFTQRLSTQTSCVHADSFSDSDHLTLQINDAVLQNAQPDLIRLQNHPRLRFYASITWRRTEPKSSGHPARLRPRVSGVLPSFSGWWSRGRGGDAAALRMRMEAVSARYSSDTYTLCYLPARAAFRNPSYIHDPLNST